MTFEIWSMQSGNLVNSYDTEQAAWQALARIAGETGPRYLEGLALLAEDDSGETQTLATGEDLARAVFRHLPQRA